MKKDSKDSPENKEKAQNQMKEPETFSLHPIPFDEAVKKLIKTKPPKKDKDKK